MRMKMSSTCWRTRMSGCVRPIAISRPGSVTSTAPAGGRDAVTAARFSVSAVSMSVLSVLTSAPNSRRRSAGTAMICLSRAVTDPLLRLRNSSSSVLRSRSVDAAESRARKSARRVSIVCRGEVSGIRLGRQRGLGLRRYLGECGTLGGSQVGQHLAVDRDAGGLDAAHQLRIGEAVLARARVDAHDPQLPVVALLAFAPHEGILA